MASAREAILQRLEHHDTQKDGWVRGIDLGHAVAEAFELRKLNYATRKRYTSAIQWLMKKEKIEYVWRFRIAYYRLPH